MRRSEHFPTIDTNCAMINALQECGLFLEASREPHILPFGLKVSQDCSMPFRSYGLFKTCARIKNLGTAYFSCVRV